MNLQASKGIPAWYKTLQLQHSHQIHVFLRRMDHWEKLIFWWIYVGNIRFWALSITLQKRPQLTMLPPDYHLNLGMVHIDLLGCKTNKQFHYLLHCHLVALQCWRPTDMMGLAVLPKVTRRMKTIGMPAMLLLLLVVECFWHVLCLPTTAYNVINATKFHHWATF